MEAKPREIERYINPNGNIPFDDWFNSLRDISAQAKIDARLFQQQDIQTAKQYWTDYRSQDDA
jgi:hypothetical protein